MPILEYKCTSCGKVFEAIIIGDAPVPPCEFCGATGAERVLSPSSTASGRQGARMPDAGGHGCCGSRPSEKGCVPGSCCGKAHG
ncbi:putative FmdB family regulatory protein [Desulfobaculum xiamenense]|uniref:Putative FmdB family regulatory protein n=1 Tax=Desulfobaculum xiamenense TaxID=995050 RepID=A0A846QQV1_9BACT|nr:zinc ribbon domain-containing protein [Desulfobaculum xiamenense]NJB68743.1 putative FmdB family regulatory protein [Desulfobaculum xiamenense]